MFLQYKTYSKQSQMKQQPKMKQQFPKASNYKMQRSQLNEDSAFSDSFMRKNRSPIHFDVEEQPKIKISDPKNKQQFDQTKVHHQEKARVKLVRKAVNSLPAKKAFQIKFLPPKNKNSSAFKSMFLKQSEKKIKTIKQHVNQRKIEPVISLSLQNPSRYGNQHQFIDQNYFQSIPDQKDEKRSSQQFSVYFKQTKYRSSQQKQYQGLIGAYKIKSLTLERNPNEQIYQKSRKYIKKLLQKKNDPNQIESLRAQSCQNAFDSIPKSSRECNRVNTQFRNRNTLDLRPPYFSGRYSRNSDRKKSFHHTNNYDSPTNEVQLEPWIKNNEQETFHDNIQEIAIEFQEKQKNLDNQKTYLLSVPGQKTTRNSFRKIYSSKQSSKIKVTILCSED